jgi:single-stranded-DNA-specific exonuclease
VVRTRADSYLGRVWLIADPGDHEPIAGTPYPDFVTKLLRRRGVESAQEALEYLFDAPPAATSPLQLPNAEVALDRIERAVRTEESIAVYGDFDVDGITSTAILTEAIRAVGGRVTPFIPNRFTDGYGIHKSALRGLRRDHDATLIITADCGISAFDEVAYAGELGQDVVIIDHHSIPDRVPDAHATVNPKLDAQNNPFVDLSTGGLAYKLAPALLERFDRHADPDQWLDLAALSTVADVVPLRGENRRIVHDGLAAIRRTTRPGLRALLGVAGLWESDLDADSIGYGLAPRINAAGRLDHAKRALSLLLETEPARAEEQAQQLDQLNLERRRMTLKAMERADQRLALEQPDFPITFVGAADIPSGIVGLVAGRLAEQRHRPAFIFEEGPEFSRASCRSIAEFDIAAALRKCDDLLVRHGGHAMAAGFTARTSDLPALKDRLAQQAREQLAEIDLRPRITIDAQAPLDRVEASQVNWLQRLAPFGEGNPAPTFVSRNVVISEARRVGADDAHLRLKLRSGSRTWPGIGFGLGSAPCGSGDHVDLVWSLKRNGLNGTIELEVKDLAPVSPDGLAQPTTG